MTEDHYGVLGISEDASEKEVEDAFYRKVRAHPPEQDPEGHERLQEAKRVLLDEELREEYDAIRRSSGKVGELKEEAERLVNRKDPDYETAIKKLKEAVVLAPELEILRNRLGQVYLQSDQPQEALEQFDKALKLSEGPPAGYFASRGQALNKLGRLEESKQALQKAWRRDVENYQFARLLARVFHKQDKVEEALKVLDRAIWADDKLDFEDFICYHAKLQIYVAEGRTEVLEEELETVKDLPETRDDREYAAFMLSQTGQMLIEANVYRLAQEFVDAAVELDPENSRLQAAQEFVQENAQMEQSFEEIAESSSIHEFVKHVVAVFYQRYLGVIDEEEFKERADEIDAGLQNAMGVDPENSEIKESVRHIRDQYPQVFQLNESAFEAILSTPDATHRVDDCPHCGDPIRFGKTQTGKGECSNCYNEIKISGKSIEKPSAGCFIATAVYGSYDHPDVVRLRRFRDEVLQRSTMGRAFIRVYYRYGPTIAQYFEGRGNMRRCTRSVLKVLVDKLL